MNESLLRELPDKALAAKIRFPELLAILKKEQIESYHVDFLRNEYRYYARSGESFATTVPLVHAAIASEFSAEGIEVMNRKVQAGEANYADFVSESAPLGCAYYIVYVYGAKVRYFGRDGGEHVQRLPGSK